MSESKKAMSLRFPDPAQRDTIATAAAAAGMSMQEYVLAAAYERATAVEHTFLDHFRASVAHSHEAFAAEPDAIDLTPEQRAAELQARHELALNEGHGRGHAA